LTTNTVAEVLTSMRILTGKANLAASRYWRMEVMQKCFFFSRLMSNHGRECDNSNLASTLQTVYLTDMCMHSKHVKTLRPHSVIFLIKIVDGFKKTHPSSSSSKFFSLKIHIVQTYKVFWVSGSGVFFYTFYTWSSVAFLVLKASVGHFICDVCTVPVPFCKINTFWFFSLLIQINISFPYSTDILQFLH
jgi:hypothetical protein